MKISIVDFDQHYDYYFVLLDVFAGDGNQFQLNCDSQFFTSHPDEIEKRKKNLCVIPHGRRRGSSLSLLWSVFRFRPHLIFFPTAENRSWVLLLLAFIYGRRCIATLHNMNYGFGRTWQKKPGPRGILNRWCCRRMMSLATLSSTEEFLLEYAEHHWAYKSPKILIPYSLYRGALHAPPANSEPVFVVPGSVHPLRRDYELIRETFEALFESGRKARLIFLGKCGTDSFGNALRSWCEVQRGKGFAVDWYDGFLSAEEFESRLAQCDFILSPIKTHIPFLGVQEVYGLTKGSALVFDAIRHSKFGIYPSHFTVDKSFAAATATFANKEELFHLIARIVDDPAHGRALAEAARAAALNFTVVATRKKVFRALELSGDKLRALTRHLTTPP